MERSFEKNLLVDIDRNAISTGFGISSLLHMRGYKEDLDLINKPLLADTESGKQVTIESSRKVLVEKVKEAALSPQHKKGHSLRIGGATVYPNSPKGGFITAVSLGLWASGAR